MNSNKAVFWWLLSGCLLVFIMVVVGGITRLTHSGLSMTDWHLVTDTFPPTTDEAWNQAFEAYKQFPEYQKINQFQPGGFHLSDYKDIYFWEWFHRFIGGRVLGPVFLFPFLYFWFKKKLDKATLYRCFILLGMGAFQGFLGWFMVKSGLLNDPDVSHFRLSMHLTFAFITFAYTFWVALQYAAPIQSAIIPVQLRRLARTTLFVLLVQIAYGGFVAGLDAGLVHNHWPLMSDGQFMHESIWLEKDSWFLRFTESKSGVQFVHRMLALTLVVLISTLSFKARKLTGIPALSWGIKAMLFGLFMQFSLGVFTLLYGVPFWLGVAHQAMAFVLLASVIFVLFQLRGTKVLFSNTK
ncbi:MAG: heme A synthase [Flavobacterium sp. BFFFF2]|nr:MAG: heme A synthase [Flavobacterium sp. BFFFF2]